MTNTPQGSFGQGGYGDGGHGQGGYGQQPAYGGGAGWGGPGGHPVKVSIERAPSQSRALALFSIPFLLARAIAAIPVVFCLYFVGIAAFFVTWIGFWAVLFTGRYPEGLHGFVTGYLRWSTRLSAWLFGLTDRYPGFSLQP